MLLNITAYKSIIQDEIKLMNQLRYKLNNQLRNLKQLQHLPLIRKKIRQIFTQISFIEKYNPKEGGKIPELKKAISNSKEKLVEAKQRIKAEGFRVQVLIEEGKFLQVSTIIFGSISRIYVNLDLIENKIDFIYGAINKLKQQKQKSKVNTTIKANQ